MSNLRFSDVRVMLADSRAHIRDTLKTALTHAGLENIEHAARMEQVTEGLEHGLGPDILICDVGLEGGDACDIIDGIRHNDIGRNPFVCILGIIWNSTEGEVDRVINSGIDLLIAAPMSPKQIIDRVESLVRNRLPWVVTGDYVGPDRRKGSEREQNLPLLQVPNTLREKSLGTFDSAKMRSEVAHAIADMSSRKIERQAATNTELADMIVQQTRRSGPTMIKAHIDRLHELVLDLDHRAAKRGFTHISELCTACVGVAEKMRGSDKPPADKDIQLLKHLSMAIRTAMNPDGRAEVIAHDIAQTVIGAR
jgi:DNA-binding response OmpR family regulator